MIIGSTSTQQQSTTSTLGEAYLDRFYGILNLK
jgi:hypothetical protein